MGETAATVCQNKIFVMGGYPPSGYPIAANEAYDPATDTWENKKPLPYPRVGCSASTVDGRIYVVGGGWAGMGGDLRYRIVYHNYTDVYDPLTDSWSPASPTPIGVERCQSVAFENRIYVLGGNVIQIYEPKTDRWLPEIRLNEIRLNDTYSGGSAARIAITTGKFAPKEIHIVDVDAHYVYDLDTGIWSSAAPLLTYRLGFSLAVVNDKIYAIGGLHLNGWRSRKTEVYTPIGYGTPDPSYGITPPEIALISPENKTYAVKEIALTLTVNEPDSRMRYELDSGTPVEFSGNITLTELSLGSHTLSVYATDEAGNVGASENIAFTVATPEPFPTNLVITASGASLAVVCVALLVYFKKRKRKT
jgi:hypothetical protein